MPTTKRQRVDKAIKPKIFQPFRLLGKISNSKPFNLVTRLTRDANKFNGQIITCLEKSWMMFDLISLRLLFISNDLEFPIESIVNDGNFIYCSSNDSIYKYKRGKLVDQLKSPYKLSKLLLFGSQLLSLKSDGSALLVWDLQSSELLHEIEFGVNFTATDFLHPSTYLNKLLVASKNGQLQLWNIRTRTLIREFNFDSPITTLQQSPAIDIVAVGCESGRTILFDLKSDTELFKVRMDGNVQITSISFRTDGEHIMATAASNGFIAFWDLNQGGNLVNVLRDAHSEPPSKIEFLPNQPILISSSGDNSLKQWLFDSPSSLPRLLKFRAGHTAPPHRINYYGEDGKTILSASKDNSLRYMSVVRDSRSFELSQGSLSRKAAQLALPIAALRLPPITSLSYATQRSKDWDDVLTCHEDSSDAYTWYVQDKKLGAHKLHLDDGIAVSANVSVCGNYGFVGSDMGTVHQFNMQSGIKRRVMTIQNKYQDKDALKISSIVTDALNTTLVCSTADGFLYFFDFHNGALLDSMQLTAGVQQLILQRDNGIMAAICSDNVIRLVDIESRRLVREFKGFTEKISDITFSPDSKWLVASSFDCIIRTYDIPTGSLVDAFRVATIPTSLTFSPTGDFLATTHIDSVGIYLWANKTQLVEVALKPIKFDDVIEVNMPTMQGEVEDEELALMESAPILPTFVESTKEQLESGLVTLSAMPRSRWTTLLNLDTIKERNKPIEAPKAPEKAPFFLPSLSDGLNNNMEVDSKNETHRLTQGSLGIETQLSKILQSEDSNRCEWAYRIHTLLTHLTVEKLFEYLHRISPANNDSDVRSLLPSDLSLFIVALTDRLRQQKDFDTIQANLGLMLRVHADILASDKLLRDKLAILSKAQRSECQRIFDMTRYSLGVLSFVRDIPLQ
ncbi:WD40 repeat-like protein [Wallemia mellicola]|nr:WD40 repeat-like protein [Wallemia mellicola]